MNTEEVFDRVDEVESEISEAEETVKRLKINRDRLMDLCNHDIVFKYKDNYPRMMVFDGNYYCPACGKTLKCTDKKQIWGSEFSESRIIPLTNLSLFGSKKVHRAIRQEVRSNMDYYYDYVIPEEDLAAKMELVLKDKEKRYERPELVLKRNTRKVEER
jgi:hypothetical protein